MQWKTSCERAEQRLGPSGRLGVHFLPLPKAGAERWAEGLTWRGEEGFPAASVIKVPIMLEALRRAQEGRLDVHTLHGLQSHEVVGGAGVLMELHAGLELTLLDLIHLMIVVSDNTASNILIDVLGMQELNEALPTMGMKNSVLARKFMVEPDSPVNKNFTTPNDMAACLDSLYRCQYLNIEYSQQGIDIMSRQQYREKIPLLLPADLKIAHKTGEISGVRHDVALVLDTERPYVLVCLTHQVEDVLVADRTIAELSRQIYQRVKGWLKSPFAP